MGRGLVLWGLAIALAACGTGVRTVRGSGDDAVYESKCKGSAADCIADAHTTCSAGYRLLDSESHAGDIVSDALPGPVTWYAMTFMCDRSGTTPAPEFAWRGPVYRPPPRRPYQWDTNTTTSSPIAPTGPSAPGPGDVTDNSASSCSSDYACGLGSICVKADGALTGMCARAVNEYGNPTYAPPRPSSVAPGEGQCSFDIDCPIGFRCVKGVGLRGNCMK